MKEINQVVFVATTRTSSLSLGQSFNHSRSIAVNNFVNHQWQPSKCSRTQGKSNNHHKALTTLIRIQLQNKNRPLVIGMIVAFLLVELSHCGLIGSAGRGASLGSSGSNGSPGRMVRLCIASVDPAKLSSQCVMCNRRDFPLTVIDCTGITKVNDLIANPLSVREATCLIYNCRRQVPDIKPEPYHGSVSHAANYHRPPLAAATGAGYPITASGSQLYEMMPPPGMLAGGYGMASGPEAFGGGPLLGSQAHAASPYMSRYGLVAGYRNNPSMQGIGSAIAPVSTSMLPRGLIGGPSLMPDRQPAAGLPYALVPAPSTFPFGSRKYKAALVPLFK